jgi:hypothetical protein
LSYRVVPPQTPFCYEHCPAPSLDERTRALEASAMRDADGIEPAASASPAGSKPPKSKALRRALILYHPDKNRAEQYGVRWAALCEELAKIFGELSIA